MFKDGNRPEGLYGEVYDKETGVKYRSNCIDRPVVGMWKEIDLNWVAKIALEEINKKLNLK
jgi:hypothetical protein